MCRLTGSSRFSTPNLGKFSQLNSESNICNLMQVSKLTEQGPQSTSASWCLSIWLFKFRFGHLVFHVKKIHKLKVLKFCNPSAKFVTCKRKKICCLKYDRSNENPRKNILSVDFSPFNRLYFLLPQCFFFPRSARKCTRYSVFFWGRRGAFRIFAPCRPDAKFRVRPKGAPRNLQGRPVSPQMNLGMTQHP